MKFKLYSIYDRCAMQFQPPFASVNNETAIRMFSSHCKSPEISVIAGDLDLFYLGEMDIPTGEITSVDGKPEFLIRFAESEV